MHARVRQRRGKADGGQRPALLAPRKRVAREPGNGCSWAP